MDIPRPPGILQTTLHSYMDSIVAKTDEFSDIMHCIMIQDHKKKNAKTNVSV
jgi:hypothetical protein